MLFLHFHRNKISLFQAQQQKYRVFHKVKLFTEVAAFARVFLNKITKPFPFLQTYLKRPHTNALLENFENTKNSFQNVHQLAAILKFQFTQQDVAGAVFTKISIDSWFCHRLADKDMALLLLEHCRVISCCHEIS